MPGKSDMTDDALIAVIMQYFPDLAFIAETCDIFHVFDAMNMHNVNVIGLQSFKASLNTLFCPVCFTFLCFTYKDHFLTLIFQELANPFFTGYHFISITGCCVPVINSIVKGMLQDFESFIIILYCHPAASTTETKERNLQSGVAKRACRESLGIIWILYQCQICRRSQGDSCCCSKTCFDEFPTAYVFFH